MEKYILNYEIDGDNIIINYTSGPRDVFSKYEMDEAIVIGKMMEQITNNEEEYEKVLKNKIIWKKVLSSLCYISVITIAGVSLTPFIMEFNKSPVIGFELTFLGGALLTALATVVLGTTAEKIQRSLKEYQEAFQELQELEARKFFLGKERTIDKNLSKEKVTEDTKSEVKTSEVEEVLDHSYAHDEMENIPVLKLPQVKTRVRKR